MAYCADLAPSAHKTENFRKSPFLNRLKSVADIICLFLVGAQASTLDVGWQARGRKDGSSNICVGYLLAVWATRQALSIPFSAINLASPLRA
jgi:hypothetical protein